MTFVGVERVGFASIEVFGEETDFAFERVDERLYFTIERVLRVYDRGNKNKKEDEKNLFRFHKWFKAINNSALRMAAPAAPRIVL